jgi:integrase
METIMSTTTLNNRYQEGSIERVKRAKGRADVWVFRWRELQEDGRRVQKKRTIGDLNRFPKLADAKRSVENLRSEINAQQERMGKMTIKELWGHYQKNELHDPEVGRSPTTIEGYLNNFKNYITPEWGETFIAEVSPVAVERWLRGLPYAPSTKSKLRNQLSALYSHAIRHRLYIGENPIATVRQGSKRLRDPDILTLGEMHAILQGLTDPMHRIAVLIAAVTGLRRSEIRGLKWCDVDFDKLWLNLRRGIVRKHQTKLKTVGSRRGIPIPQDLADALIEWRGQCLYRADDNWVLASPTTNGRNPLWLDIVLQRYIHPILIDAGITKTVGWHTFRRSLSVILANQGEKVKVVQELLRHSNVSTTLELYQQADQEAKRAAQNHTRSLFVVQSKAS